MNAETPFFRRHLLFGWWSLLFYLALGVVLEALHGFKVSWYLDVGKESRRLLWTLAHAHGTLLGLIHLAFAWTADRGGGDDRMRKVASPLLLSASILLPGGFFLGGVVIYGSDPGMGILLVPIGALFLLLGVFLVALSVSRRPPPTP